MLYPGVLYQNIRCQMARAICYKVLFDFFVCSKAEVVTESLT